VSHARWLLAYLSDGLRCSLRGYLRFTAQKSIWVKSLLISA
jgi:hypothetical protein